MLDKYKILRTAEKYVVAGKFSQAVDQYQKLLEQEPEEPTLLNTVGDLLVRQGRLQEALGYYRQVADLYLSSGYVVKATAMFKKILRLDSDDLRSHERLAELFEKQGLHFDAAAQLRAIIKAKSQSDELDQALDFAERLCQVVPQDPGAWLDRARLALKAGQGRRTVEYFSRAVELFNEKKRYAQGWEAACEMLAVESGDREVLDLFVESASQSGQLEAGRHLLQQEIESTGEDFPYRYYLGLIFEQQGDMEQAAANYSLLQERGYYDGRVTEGLVRTGVVDPLPALQDADEDAGVEAIDAPESSPSKPAENEASSGLFSTESNDFEPGDSGEVSELSVDEEGAEPFPEEQGSGLFDIQESGSAEPDDGVFRLEKEAPPNPMLDTSPLENEFSDATVVDMPSDEIASVDEAIEEADFYLKLGFKEDATLLLQRLATQYPRDERVLTRARKVGLEIEAPAEAAIDADSEEFATEIESALDGLFSGTEEERSQPEEVLRYDYAAPSGESGSAVHYDLGLAYKEMGLLDDAVQEFLSAYEGLDQAEQDPQRILCCSMLASCYLQMENQDSAIEWARQGLTVPGRKEFETKALQFDLASALEQSDRQSEALEIYSEIHETDPNYRDVAARLERLDN